jgi:hypothetical protein
MMGKFTPARRGAKGGEYTQAHSPRHAWRFFSVDLEKITAFAKAQVAANRQQRPARQGRRGSQLAEGRAGESKAEAARDDC